MFSQMCICPQGVSTWAGTPPPQAGTPPAGTPPPQRMLGYSQQAGGTHPTGMHSCSGFVYKKVLLSPTFFPGPKTHICLVCKNMPRICFSFCICFHYRMITEGFL